MMARVNHMPSWDPKEQWRGQTPVNTGSSEAGLSPLGTLVRQCESLSSFPILTAKVLCPSTASPALQAGRNLQNSRPGPFKVVFKCKIRFRELGFNTAFQRAPTVPMLLVCGPDFNQQDPQVYISTGLELSGTFTGHVLCVFLCDSR